MKKPLLWLLVVLLSVSMVATFSLAGCKEEAAEEEAAEEEAAEEEVVVEEPVEEIEIEFVNWWVGAEPFTNMGDIMMQEFNDKYKGTYKITKIGVPNYPDCLTKIKTDVAAGKTPDLFMQSENVQEVAGTWLDGILADMTPYIDEEFLSWKSPSLWALTTQNGKIVGVNYGDLVTGIFYNKTMFEEAGIQLPIKTWDDFFVAGDKLKAAGVAPIALENLEGWVPMLMFTEFVGGYGGPDILFGLKDFNDPAFLEGAKFLLKLKDYTTNDVPGAGYQIAANNFMGERAAMIANGPWMVSDMKNVEGFFEKVGLLPFPGYKADASPIMMSGPGMKICINKELESDAAKMKGAMEYLRYISMPENIKRMVIDSGTIIRSLKVDYSDATTLEPLTIEFLTLLEEAAYTVPNTRDQVGKGFDIAFSEEIGKLWSGETTPEQFIQNLNKKVFDI